MPRTFRRKSASGIYHVMLRGVNKRSIFSDSNDYSFFLYILEQVFNDTDGQLLAYCLMKNHVHLLIKEQEVSVSKIMQRLSGRYAQWYNQKYERVGHLFQDRFRSEPVDSEDYFFRVLRYIHLNPVEAKLCQSVNDYKYSSYRDYFDNPLIFSDFVEKMIERSSFEAYHTEEKIDEENVDSENVKVKSKYRRVGDITAKSRMFAICKCESIAEFQGLSKEVQDAVCIKLLEEEFPVNQVSRITGKSYRAVKKYCKK